MPTVLNYLGYDRPYLAFGQDMLNTPPDQTIAMQWVPEADGYEFVKGNYAIDFDGEHITHAFRYLPMLVLVLANYAKFLKNVTVKSLTYGNYEAREGTNAPIVNLLPIAALQDWTTAAEG